MISPSSAQHPPQSLNLILKAALAGNENNDNDVCGREYQYSEEFFRLDKSGVQDKGNFSSVFSPITSNKGDETEIMQADLNFKEESNCSDEDEITEEDQDDYHFKTKFNSSGSKSKARRSSLKSPTIKHAASMPQEAKNRSTSFPEKSKRVFCLQRA